MTAFFFFFLTIHAIELKHPDLLLHYSRVYPEITLKALRDDLATLLGGDTFLDRYSFLKCVGRSLALVGVMANNNRLVILWACSILNTF